LIEIEQINKSIKLGIIDLHEFNTIHGLVSKREIEKKALIYLLKALNINSDELVYNENNKPFLISGKPFLSITHSFQYLAVVVNSEMLTGIDMELKRLKIINVQSKFCNANEVQFAGNEIDRLTCLWCAKETVYKIYGHKGVNFKDHIKVKPFHTADTVIYASLWVANAWKTFKLALKSKQDYYLTYLIDEV
jgi:phosphopantetheinyl transferase